MGKKKSSSSANSLDAILGAREKILDARRDKPVVAVTRQGARVAASAGKQPCDRLIRVIPVDGTTGKDQDSIDDIWFNLDEAHVSDFADLLVALRRHFNSGVRVHSTHLPVYLSLTMPVHLIGGWIRIVLDSSNQSGTEPALSTLGLFNGADGSPTNLQVLGEAVAQVASSTVSPSVAAASSSSSSKSPAIDFFTAAYAGHLWAVKQTPADQARRWLLECPLSTDAHGNRVFDGSALSSAESGEFLHSVGVRLIGTAVDGLSLLAVLRLRADSRTPAFRGDNSSMKPLINFIERVLLKDVDEEAKASSNKSKPEAAAAVASVKSEEKEEKKAVDGHHHHHHHHHHKERKEEKKESHHRHHHHEHDHEKKKEEEKVEKNPASEKKGKKPSTGKKKVSKAKRKSKN